jgi:hypothetical protein
VTRRLGRRPLLALLTGSALLSISACAPNRLDLPTGTGTLYPDAAAAYEEAVQDCRGARTIAVTLALSGRAGSIRLRGNLDAGFEAPDKVRLEMRAPIGRPVFILAAPGAEATLYFPRDNRVLRQARPAEVVEALVGLSLDGAQLRALVSGCGFGVAAPSEGRSHDGRWIVVDTGDAKTYLRQHDARWRVEAAARPGLTVHYSGFVNGRASTLRLQAPDSKADVTARLSDMNINVPLQAAVFAVDVPEAAEPLTLDELRQAGPLGRE